MLTEELNIQAAVMDKQHAAQSRRIARLLKQRQKLLEAHYADAIPLDQLRSEQARIATELTKAEELMNATTIRHDQLRHNLKQCLDQAHRWHHAYQHAAPDLRREINQTIFKAIYLGHDHPTISHLAEPYHTLLSNETTAATIDHARQHGHEPDWLNTELQALHEEWHAERTRNAAQGRCRIHNPCNTQTPPPKGQGLSFCTLVHLMRQLSNPRS